MALSGNSKQKNVLIFFFNFPSAKNGHCDHNLHDELLVSLLVEYKVKVNS